MCGSSRFFVKVDAKQVSELLDIIVGQNSIIFELCMDANKEFQAKHALAEKYVCLDSCIFHSKCFPFACLTVTFYNLATDIVSHNTN
jgi:hypothetical protein